MRMHIKDTITYTQNFDPSVIIKKVMTNSAKLFERTLYVYTPVIQRSFVGTDTRSSDSRDFHF